MSQAVPTAELNTKPATATQWLIGKSDEVPERGRSVVDAGGKIIGVYRVDGVLYAYENSCRHQGRPVCRGRNTPERASVGIPSFAFAVDISLSSLNTGIRTTCSSAWQDRRKR